MAWIRQIALGEATGKLRELYDAAIKRAGRVFGILRVQSLAPQTLDASTEMYRAIMFGASIDSRRGLVMPKTPKVGIASATPRCMSPESLATSASHWLIRAAVSARLSCPTKLRAWSGHSNGRPK